LRARLETESMTDATKDTEVLVQAKRRTFTAEYKRAILREADGCTQRGEIGALLRREGLYSSHLVDWRVALGKSDLMALAPKKRGPTGRSGDPRERQLVEKDREIARLKKRLERAEAIIDVQKKLSVILGIELPDTDEKS